jgi:hypothetical protein
MDNYSENSQLGAFPIDVVEGRNNHQRGLTKREWFAGIALQGLLAACDHSVPVDVYPICDLALEVADGMLKTLETR